uniref:Uncharacterized protein MANES_07G028100 n=1 Tax=Rhizophora mucronata TaxID=61149 RepID=A0A2P2IYU4_RHIMU
MPHCLEDLPSRPFVFILLSKECTANNVGTANQCQRSEKDPEARSTFGI